MYMGKIFYHAFNCCQKISQGSLLRKFAILYHKCTWECDSQVARSNIRESVPGSIPTLSLAVSTICCLPITLYSVLVTGILLAERAILPKLTVYTHSVTQGPATSTLTGHSQAAST